MYKFENCLFTGLPKTSSGGNQEMLQYTVGMPHGNVLIRLPLEALRWHEDGFFLKNKYIFEGLLLNNRWFEDTQEIITIPRLKELLAQGRYPVTPKDKADTLFQYLLNMQDEDGEEVELEEPIPFKVLFFKSQKELVYYIQYLTDQKLIESNMGNYLRRDSDLVSFTMTIDGLNYGIQLNAEGDKSNLCFIAMSFNPKTTNIRNAIKEALWDTGFKEIIIDELNIDSDKTINDEIIANLKKCRFCIADFSYHSNGVYFESGFALGQGKKVIYTCLKSEFEKAHFDIKPLQHIIYETAEQLKIDLKHKIEAWVI